MHVKIEGLKKSFGGNPILRGIDLEIPSGQLCVILGGSGTGKSVLLKHLVGLYKPDTGRIMIDNEDIVPKTERQMLELRKRFGMIFQGGGMLQSLTVGQNVGLALRELYNESEDKIREIVSEKLESVGLKDREDQMPSTLSGGQIKRAAIARALTTRADCLLFDEPTAGLDPIMSGNIDEVIQEVNQKTNATTIVVTHDLASVFKIAEMVHFLYEGQVIASAPPEEFRQSTDPRVREFLSREIPAAASA